MYIATILTSIVSNSTFFLHITHGDLASYTIKSIGAELDNVVILYELLMIKTILV
jgi:hypothetical protein